MLETKELPKSLKFPKQTKSSCSTSHYSFFKEKDIFNIDDFAHEVIAQPEIIEKLHQYKQEYENQSAIVIDNRFEISEPACKKQQRSYRRVINLDKKIQIFIAGNHHNIEQGEDERSKFYKVYYKEEE